LFPADSETTADLKLNNLTAKNAKITKKTATAEVLSLDHVL
jgi:hypothetical protein